MEPERLLPRLQVLVTCLYPEPDQSNSCPHPTSWKCILILFSHVRLGLSSGLFRSPLLPITGQNFPRYFGGYLKIFVVFQNLYVFIPQFFREPLNVFRGSLPFHGSRVARTQKLECPFASQNTIKMTKTSRPSTILFVRGEGVFFFFFFFVYSVGAAVRTGLPLDQWSLFDKRTLDREGCVVCVTF